MKVILEAENSPSLWHWGGDTAYLDIYALEPFQTLDGQFILSGQLALRDAYLRVTCEVQPGNVLYIPSFEIDSTLDSPTNPAARYGAVIRDYRNVVRVVGWPQALSNWSLTNVASQRWEDVINRNSAQFLANPSPTYLNQTQTQSLIDSALGARNFSSETVVGVTALSEDPSDPEFPIAVSTTDPLWLALIGGGTGSEKYLSSYTDLDDAIATIGSDVNTLVIDAQPVLTADTVIPANISTRWLGIYAVDDGNGPWELNLVGPIINERTGIVDAYDPVVTLSLENNDQVSKVQPEWFAGALALWGNNRLVADVPDTAVALQACVIACRRAGAQFAMADASGENNIPSTISGNGWYGRTISFASGCWYKVSTTVKVEGMREHVWEGNNCGFIWKGTYSLTSPMFDIVDCYHFQARNFRIVADNSVTRPCLLAGIQARNDPNGTTTMLSSVHVYEHIIMDFNAGGAEYGWLVGGLTGGLDWSGVNNEQHEWHDCYVADATIAGLRNEGSQAREHKLYNFRCNTENRGFFCIINNGGSMAIYGGGGGVSTVADFMFAGAGTETNKIIDWHSESSVRFIVGTFNYIISGLVGTVPTPASLTMTTPLGSVLTGPQVIASPTNGTVTNVTAYTFTYAANSDTYESVKPDGTIQRQVFAAASTVQIPADIGLGIMPDPNADATFTQRVRTDGTQITRVDKIGGNINTIGTTGSAILVMSCRFASAGALALDGRMVVHGYPIEWNFISNNFNNGNTGAVPKIAVPAYNTSVGPPYGQSGMWIQGNSFRCLDGNSLYLKLSDYLQIVAVNSNNLVYNPRSLPTTVRLPQIDGNRNLGMGVETGSGLATVNYIVNDLRPSVDARETPFADGDATPSVAAAYAYVTANTTPTSITTFDSGIEGQTIQVRMGDNNTTIVHGATIKNTSGVDIAGVNTQMFSYTYRTGVWYQS